MRALLTPAYRAAALPYILTQGRPVTMKDVERDLAKLAHDQWVDFHWTSDNPNIHKDIRMFPPPASHEHACCVSGSICFLGGKAEEPFGPHVYTECHW